MTEPTDLRDRVEQLLVEFDGVESKRLAADEIMNRVVGPELDRVREELAEARKDAGWAKAIGGAARTVAHRTNDNRNDVIARLEIANRERDEARAELADVRKQVDGYCRQWLAARDTAGRLRSALAEAVVLPEDLDGQIDAAAWAISEQPLAVVRQQLRSLVESWRPAVPAEDTPEPAGVGDRIRIKTTAGSFNSHDATILEVRDNGMFAIRTDLDRDARGSMTAPAWPHR